MLARRWPLLLCFLFGLLALPSAASAYRYLGEQELRVAAAGDLACASPLSVDGCRAADTAALLPALDPDLVLPLGDLVYPDGALADLLSGYQPTWGAWRNRSFPVPGNHEYLQPGASGYRSYWGLAAGQPTWHALRTRHWLILGLDSNCAQVGGCDARSPQGRWLAAQLRRPRACIMAAWHHPRRSSGAHGDQAAVQPLWAALAAARVDLVLNGHDHHYERFGLLDRNARPARTGARQFVVGTGGKSLYPVGAPHPGSRARVAGQHGVLLLNLRTAGYTWQFQPLAGPAVDAGRSVCRH